MLLQLLNSIIPQNKVAQTGIAGAMTTVVFWLLESVCAPQDQLPPLVAWLITTVISFLSGYSTHDPEVKVTKWVPSRKVLASTIASFIVPVLSFVSPCFQQPSDRVVAEITTVIMFIGGYLVPEKK